MRKKFTPERPGARPEDRPTVQELQQWNRMLQKGIQFTPAEGTEAIRKLMNELSELSILLHLMEGERGAKVEEETLTSITVVPPKKALPKAAGVDRAGLEPAISSQEPDA